MIETIIKIGITCTGTDVKHNNYVNWLKVNKLIEITRLSLSEDNLEEVNNLDGIVMSGGLDMHPKFYQSEITDYPNAPTNFDEKRDEFEMAVFELSQIKSIPVLCICRGMQLVNCSLGGTLRQDIGPISNGIHQFEENDKAHGIDIVPDTLLQEITGFDRGVVNSAHHQSIDQLGIGLAINCTADDGIIEGIEWYNPENKSFFLGVQWHPERMFKLHLQDSPLTKNLRDRFINEIKKSIENLL